VPNLSAHVFPSHTSRSPQPPSSESESDSSSGGGGGATSARSTAPSTVRSQSTSRSAMKSSRSVTVSRSKSDVRLGQRWPPLRPEAPPATHRASRRRQERPCRSESQYAMEAPVIPAPMTTMSHRSGRGGGSTGAGGWSLSHHDWVGLATGPMIMMLASSPDLAPPPQNVGRVIYEYCTIYLSM